MKYLVLIMIAFASIACESQQEKEAGIEVISPTDFALKMESLDNEILIDVRTPDEWEGGIIEGAVKINFFEEDFNAKIQKLDHSKPVFVYCKKGGRSAKAAKKLEEAGFKTIYDLAGGYDAWSTK